MKARRKIELDKLIPALAVVTYPTLREEYTADCCIAAAAILTRVFDEYGYKAETVPVTVHLFNKAMLELMDRKAIPDDEDKRKILFQMTGAWGVGIVPASAILSELSKVRGGGYGGHLLVRVGGWLLDPTIQQAQRLEKNMPMPNMIATQSAKDFERDGKLTLLVGECVVAYTRINDQSYRTAPDWVRRSTPFPESVRNILARTKAELEKEPCKI